MSQLAELGNLWHSIQTWLFPVLEDELGELDDRHREFVAVCEICSPRKHLVAYRWGGNGCPPKNRLALCKAFIAKISGDTIHNKSFARCLKHVWNAEVVLGSACRASCCVAWLEALV